MEKRLSIVIALVILILTGINGIFTYSGALLYIGEMFYAILFAIAVQFAISISLIALPYVKGLGKPVLILVYIGATALSTLSAYTYIYNAGRGDDEKNRHLCTKSIRRLFRSSGLFRPSRKSKTTMERQSGIYSGNNLYARRVTT